MKYDVPIFARTYPGGRVTLAAIAGDAEGLTSVADTRAAAEAALIEAIEARIADPDRSFAERVAEAGTPELRRIKVDLRVRRGSGRRVEVTLPVTAAVFRPPAPTGGAPGPQRAPAPPLEVVVPRLGLRLDVGTADEVDDAVGDEVRASIGSRDDSALLGLLPDAEETLEVLSVDAPPRARVLGRRRRKPPARSGPLDEAGVDLTAEVRRGGPAAAYGRDAEVGAVLAALAADPPASVLLSGPSGVGKTAIVHEAARRIALGLAPKPLAGARVYYLSGNRLIAGMSLHGDWQERAKRIVDDARGRRVAIFVDDLAELCEAGRTSEAESGGAARFFAPHVVRGEIALIAEATPERLRRVERLDPGLLPLFRRIGVAELHRESALDVLRRAAGPLGRARGVRVEADALAAALDATRRFVPGRRLPGKAVELLARAIEAKVRPGSSADGILDRLGVLEVFSAQTGLPPVVLRDDLPLERSGLVAFFEERVLDQPAAAGALADAVLLAKAGLQDPGKPIASYLFAGPTGVGKTESAKALAERLFGDPARLARFDMSEFQDGAGALRLLGSEGAGEGELGKRVRERPFGVVLLDEIEKAHPSVFDALLSVLGEGRLTDAGGRVADFRSSIVILTSNLGAAEADPIGFGGARPGAEERIRAAAAVFFRPELLNRIDRVVPFSPLSVGAIERLARRELAAVLGREGFERRGVAVRFGPELAPPLARAGFHPRFGARPLKREIERRVLDPLARHLVRRSGRAEIDIELYLDPRATAREDVEVRLAARERRPRPTLASEFFDAAPDVGGARLAAGLAAVRRRLLDLRESWLLRAPAAQLMSAKVDATLTMDLLALDRLDGEIERAADATRTRDMSSVEQAAVTGLAAIDARATGAELELIEPILGPEAAAALPEALEARRRRVEVAGAIHVEDPLTGLRQPFPLAAEGERRFRLAAARLLVAHG